jgi:hypothetical protein
MRLPYKKLSLAAFEDTLSERYKGKLCSFTYPGYDIVYGMCEEIAVDTVKLPAVEIVIQLGRADGIHRYSCSAETLTECLKVINNGATQ